MGKRYVIIAGLSLLGSALLQAQTLTFEAGIQSEIDLGPLASRTQGKPISPSSSGPPYRVTGTDSVTSNLYEYFTDNPYYQTSRAAWQHEGTAVVTGGGTYTVELGQSFTDGASDTRTGIIRMRQNSNCGSVHGSNLHPVTGNPSYCAVFGPEIWTAAFPATAGQALSIDYAATDSGDDYEVYGWLVAVNCSDPGDLSTCDYGGGQGENATDPTTTHNVFLYSRGDNLDWNPASGEVPADGNYRFRFTNGSFDGTGGKALGNFFYVDPNSLVVATAQSISFAQPDDRIRDPGNEDTTPFYGDFTVEPTILSGAPIILTSDTPANCTVSDGDGDGVWDVDIDDSGSGQDTCTLVATAAAGTYGGVDYAAATPVSRSFLVLDTPIEPSNTAAPSVVTSGTVESRTTVTFDEGSWTNGGATIISTTYQWFAVDLGDSSEAPIAGATGEFYCIDDSVVGNGLRVTVTKTNAVGATSSESSPTTAVVQGSGACDTMPPSVTLSPTLLPDDTIRVDVTFSESVTRFDVTDLLVDGPASPISFTGSGDSYSVLFPAGSGLTDVRIPADVAIDASGNDNTVSNTVRIGDLDNDGIPDTVEGTGDSDGDGIPDAQDTDSDGDGIPDAEETAGDSDGDGTPNYLDGDSDGDGITDQLEGGGDTDGDGVPDALDTDADGDGITDQVEGSGDSDGDGIPDAQDTDSDGDGIPDAEETAGDSDGDGTPNYLDGDSDGDGIADEVEGSGDADGDGIPNSQDTDADGDGTNDTDEGAGDVDNDGIPDFADSDSDNDGIDDDVDVFPLADTEVSEVAGDVTVTLRSLPSDSSSSCTLDESAFDPDAAFPDTAEYDPYGRAVSFAFTGCSAGETITILLDFGETLPVGSRIHKVDASDWSAPLGDVTVEGSVFRYEVTDGGPRDADGVANGVIIDPVTASLPPPGNPNPEAIPALPPGLLILLSGFIGLLGSRRMRR